MGTLYREIVEYKKLKTSRVILKLIYAVLAIDLIFIFYILSGTIEETIYIGLGVGLLGSFASIVVGERCRRRYRYGIIDKELIIEKLSGRRRRMELNINLKTIISIEKLGFRQSDKALQGEQVFTYNRGLSSVYRCIYEENGCRRSFIFEPSSALLKKIEKYR